MPTDTELWRAGSLMALDDAIPQAASMGTLSPVEMTDEWEAARAARFRHDDAALMEYLMKLCPTIRMSRTTPVPMPKPPVLVVDWEPSTLRIFSEVLDLEAYAVGHEVDLRTGFDFLRQCETPHVASVRLRVIGRSRRL